MEQKPKTLSEGFARMRDGDRTTEQHFGDLADVLEILVVIGTGGTDKRDLDRDITDFRD